MADIEPADDVWLSLVEASMAFLDTDATFGSHAERTRAARVRLASAVNDFAVYQEALSRLPGPMVRRIK